MITRNDIDRLVAQTEIKELLWTNASPTSDFTAQTILDSGELSGYTAIELVYKQYKTLGAAPVCRIDVPTAGVTLDGFINVNGGNPVTFFQRVCNVSSSGVEFLGCSIKTASGTTSTNNAGCVPCKIYGIRTNG